MQAFDYIIADAGATGALIACRLSEMVEAQKLARADEMKRDKG
jgi:hypothetical protein